MVSQGLQEESGPQVLLVQLVSLVHKALLERRENLDYQEIQGVLDVKGSEEITVLLEVLEIKGILAKMVHLDLMDLQDMQEPLDKGGWWVFQV